jgi:hypothetical protein
MVLKNTKMDRGKTLGILGVGILITQEQIENIMIDR